MEMIASELRDNGVSEENIICLDLDKRGFKIIIGGKTFKKISRRLRG